MRIAPCRSTVVLLYACLTALITTTAFPNSVEFEIEEEDVDVAMETVSKASPDNALKVTDFSWNDCGSTFSEMTIKSLDIGPDPIVMPGALYLTTDLVVNSAIDSPLVGGILMEKKVLKKYVKIPCIDHVGSCTYNALCDLLEQVPCPGSVVKTGWNCRCPITTGTYNMPKSEFDIMATVIPSGDYHIVANVTHNAKTAVCLDVHFSIEN